MTRVDPGVDHGDGDPGSLRDPVCFGNVEEAEVPLLVADFVSLGGGCGHEGGGERGHGGDDYPAGPMAGGTPVHRLIPMTPGPRS